MFEAPLHPKIVHLPIALALLMPLMSAGLLVAWWKDWWPDSTWAIAVALQAMLVAGSWVAMETGENDEERVEQVVPESVLETHEERAETFLWASGSVLVLILLPLVVPGRRRRRWLAVVACAGTFVVLGLGYRVGRAGGDLVYQHGAGQAHSGGTSSSGGRALESDEDEHAHPRADD